MNIAFASTTLDPTPTWTRLDDTDHLVASYTIDRGRSIETDRTDGARATVTINDKEGLLDPTNAGGPYIGLLQPLLQIALGRYNPVAAEWQTRFRGFISDYDYSFDPSQRINRLTLSCIDLFEILNSIDMLPYPKFGDDPSTDAPESVGQVWFAENQVGGGAGRIDQIMTNALIDTAFYVAFSGNVELWATVYSPGESAMTAIQEAADAEFPGGVANVFTDRFGRLVFHGRLAKFDPATIAAGAGDAAWDWHHWHCGDGAAVASAPSVTAQIREFSFNRGLAEIVNSAYATPAWNAAGNPLTAAEKAGQIVEDTGSQAIFGIRSWSAENLQTKTGLLDSSDSLAEALKFATYKINNYAAPLNRITTLGFLSMRPDRTGAAANWRLLCKADISDLIGVTIDSPGGGGFTDDDFVIEGIHETNEPLNGQYDKVTMRLDVSPQALYTDSGGVFPTS